MTLIKTFALLVSVFWIFIPNVHTQEQKIADSLVRIYQQNTMEETEKLELLRNLSFNEINNLERGLAYAEELIHLAQQTGNDNYLRVGYFLKGTKKRLLGALDEAIEAYFKSAEIARKTQNKKSEGESYGAIADTYSEADNHANAMHYYYRAIGILQQSNDSISHASYLSNTGDEYLKTKKYDSALYYFNQAKGIFDKVNYMSGKGYSLGNIGMVYANINKNDLAEKFINQSIAILEEAQDYYPICVYLTSLADVYLNKRDTLTALNYTLQSLHLAEKYDLKKQVADASLKLSDLYERAGNISEAFRHYKKHIIYRDSIINLDVERNMANQRYNHGMSQKQQEVDLVNKQKRTQRSLTISLGIILGLAIIILGVLFKNFQNRQKAYKVLNLQKQETDIQKTKAENALIELQLTQKQLIQTAKMASLGELTAGIAHEIKNPLNFVNNFSEISIELLNELREETVNKLTDSEKAEAEQIISDLDKNLKKISDHGKRADSIVKGMLQHSKASTGIKEPTDINAIADEYLRLSYHGLRAKDKEFNINFTTDFDKNIGKIEVVPQDIGRVLLNLYNNAFYAVNEKKKQRNGAFEPLVSVSTKKISDKVEISVKDNGIGIPQEVLEKIFQPFFTTKPTGQGTGLGLSLSYDIIKAHGGELKVETEEGAFAEFIIQLPFRNNQRALI